MFDDIREQMRDGVYSDHMVMLDARDVFGDRCYVSWRKKNRSPETLTLCLFCGWVGPGRCPECSV